MVCFFKIQGKLDGVRPTDFFNDQQLEISF